MSWLVIGNVALLTLAGCQATNGPDTKQATVEESSTGSSEGATADTEQPTEDGSASSEATDASGTKEDGSKEQTSSISLENSDNELADPSTTEQAKGFNTGGSAPQKDATKAASSDEADEQKPDAPFPTADHGADEGVPSTAKRSLSDTVARLRQATKKGNWQSLSKQLQAIPKERADRIYSRLLNRLASPGRPDGADDDSAGAEADRPKELLPEEIVTLAKMAPTDLRIDHLTALGRLLDRTLEQGFALAPLLTQWQADVAQLGESEREGRAGLAWLLMEVDRTAAASRFAPDLRTAVETESPHIAIVAARHAHQREGGLSNQDKKALSKLWTLSQDWLTRAGENGHSKVTASALAIHLLPLLEPDVADAWLRERFEEQPQQAQALMDELVRLISRRTRQVDGAPLLQLQSKAVRLLLQTVETGPDWQPIINESAQSWLRAAETHLANETTKSKRRSKARPSSQQIDRSQAEPTDASRHAMESLIESAPAETWLSALPSSLEIRVHSTLTRLSLASQRPSEALSHIAALASNAPDLATRLSHRLLEHWTSGRDQAGTASTMEDLMTTVTNLRSMKDLSVDGDQILRAFLAYDDDTVFSGDRIKSLFGPFEARSPELLGTVARGLDARLTDQWLQPDTVISDSLPLKLTRGARAGIQRHYGTLDELISSMIEAHPRSWKLRHSRALIKTHQALFAALHAETGTGNPDFQPPLEAFRSAAERHRNTLTDRPSSQSTEPSSLFQDWLRALTYQREKGRAPHVESADSEDSGLATAFSRLPDDALNAYKVRLANGLLDRLGIIPPSQRRWHLRQGVALIGEHPAASKINNRLDYYNTLLDEVRLSTTLQSNQIEGKGQMLGVSVGLQHTAGLARRTGRSLPFLRSTANLGTTKAQGKEGRPTGYRSQLEERLREQLKERFTIEAFTFHSPDARPHSVEKSGWRETPVAYLILQPKESSVDRLPSLTIDVPFPDEPGFVTLPVRSTGQRLGSGPETAPSRAVSDLEVAQMLDTRNWKEERELTLTVRALGRGLVPELRHLLESPGGGRFNADVQEATLRIRDIDAQASTIMPITERRWEIRLTPSDKAGRAKRFPFPNLLAEADSVDYREWRDDRQVTVDPELVVSGVPLESRSYMPAMLVLTGLVIIGFAVWLLTRRGSLVWSRSRKHTYQLPSPVTPYTVLNLLRQLESDPKVTLDQEERAELERTIRILEDSYFSKESERQGNGVDLDHTARQWIQRFHGNKNGNGDNC